MKNCIKNSTYLLCKFRKSCRVGVNFIKTTEMLMTMKIRKVFLIFFIMIFSAFAFVACKTTQPKTAQLYIKKYMDKEALEIQQAVTCSKVERVGDSIKITFIDK